MIDSIHNWVVTFEFNSWMGFLLYYVPMLFCSFFYSWRTLANLQRDINWRKGEHIKEYKDRHRDDYVPSDTIGTLIGRAIVSILPVANIWAAAFDLSPKVFGRFFEWIGKVFNQPLVPDHSHYENQRKHKAKEVGELKPKFDKL